MTNKSIYTVFYTVEKPNVKINSIIISEFINLQDVEHKEHSPQENFSISAKDILMALGAFIEEIIIIDTSHINRY